MVNAISTGRFIQKSFVEHRREFIEIFEKCKQFGEFLDIKNNQKRRRAPKPIFLGLGSEKSENQVPNFGKFEKYLKFAYKLSVHNGSDTFPNELVRFRFEAKPIWGKIQKHCKMQSSSRCGSDFFN